MKLSNLKILVTGGAGFIGSHLVDALIEKNNQLIVLDDFSSGKKSNLAQASASGKLEIFDQCILNYQEIYPLFSEVDVVFHMATRNVRLSLKQPTIVHDVNTTGTLNVLKAAKGNGVQKFLYCSSSEVNGTAVKVPMKEDYAYNPETIYGASKLTGEYYTQVFERSGWLNTVIARPHNNYGPREHWEGMLGEVIPRFILMGLLNEKPTIFGDGKQTRDFTYVTETVRHLIAITENDQCRGEIFNICKGNEVSVLDIAKIISKQLGRELDPVFLKSRPSDVLRLFGDNSKLKEFVSSAPEMDIEEGMQLTIDWFKENIDLEMVKGSEKLADINWDKLDSEPWLEG
ncbi:MAG: NAD-dependent epimerase/dehydratase family protein [Halobacteriovoraceae bacterium]|nr:NAD-dependent epimerase/dehydratase family protein [Halobacteriovoraceae bacterium]MBT5094752.1 NAD-dependent epimerase/dehydratase family protein [Halobacteriovoraceae bacterium]